MGNDDKPKPDFAAGLKALAMPMTSAEQVTDSSDYGKTPSLGNVVVPTEITVKVLNDIVDKYIDKFVKRFPKLIMQVHFTSNGQPPTPPDLWDAEAEKPVSGRFLKVGNEYRIGINNDLILPAQLMTFFHEYGHAVYKREANEAIDNSHALIRTETAALLSSLRLSEEEGLPEIAYLSVYGARQAALTDPIYQAAIKNVEADPLWQKYSEQPSD